MSNTCKLHENGSSVLACQHLISGQSGRYIPIHAGHEYVCPACIQRHMSGEVIETHAKCQGCFREAITSKTPTSWGRVPHIGTRPKRDNDNAIIEAFKRWRDGT